MTIPGQVNWIELQTHDIERAMKFYSETVGWSFLPEKMPSGGTYWIAYKSELPMCGFLTLESNDCATPCDQWVSYIHIEDISDVLPYLKKTDGKILIGPRVIEGIGEVALIQDAGGAKVGFVTPCSKYN